MLVKTVQEREDGFALIEVELTPEQIPLIMQTGLQFLMLRGALTLTALNDDSTGVEIDKSKLN